MRVVAGSNPAGTTRNKTEEIYMSKVGKHKTEAQRRAEFKCPCGKLTCGVNKTSQQITKGFLAWFGDSPETRATDRKVKAMVPVYHGHHGR